MRLLKMTHWWYVLKYFFCASPSSRFTSVVISIIMNLADIQQHNISPTMAAKYQMGSGDFRAKYTDAISVGLSLSSHYLSSPILTCTVWKQLKIICASAHVRAHVRGGGSVKEQLRQRRPQCSARLIFITRGATMFHGLINVFWEGHLEHAGVYLK